MDFTEVECALCGKVGYRMGMDRLTGTDGKPIGGGFRCPDGKCALPKSEPMGAHSPTGVQGPTGPTGIQGRTGPEFPFNPVPLRIVKDDTPPATPVHPLQQEFGFKQPEDGSGKRYADRRAKTPWARHTFWWWLHNAVAHPLIAFVPIRMFFRFHDWTSRRMHGLK